VVGQALQEGPLVAVAWAEQLQLLLDVGPTLEDAQRSVYGMVETPHQFRGIASWYGPYFHGRQTATGEIFDQHDLTAAHKTLPFGTYLKVRNLLNDRIVVVRINDRGPYVGERSLDLSYAAAQCLNSETVGVIPYEATILEADVPTLRATDMLTAQR
jgi:rare lipoprotein A (peptidoglycan hydrolase)